MKKLWVIGVALILGAAEVHAQSDCTVNVRTLSERSGRRYTIAWDAVPGADTYVLEESFDNFRTVNKTTLVDRPGEQLSREFTYQASVDVRVKYRVTASSSIGTLKPCSTTKEVSYSPDVSYRRVVQKSAIPLVGSTAGLNGAQFKTSVRLRATEDDQRGTLVLRRNGIPGTDRDPMMPYALAKKGDAIFFDDIVASFGQSGLGSIDIIPDGNAGGGLTVPFAEVRLFNVANGGTFGTIESQTQPFDWTTDVAHERVTSVVVPNSDLRLNLGVRSFTSSIVTITVSRGRQNVASIVHSPGGDSLMFGSAKDITGATDLQPGDVIRFGGMGTFVPMYTLTDNRTNDPALYIAPVKVDLDVESYIEK